MVGYSNGKTVVSSGKKTPILKSLDKAFELLECYIQDGSSYTIDELARKLQVSKGTIHRILVTAQKRGFMEQDVMTKRYHLGLKLFELGTAVANRMDLRKESLPILNILSKKTGQASQILIKSNGDAIGIEKLEGKSYLRMLFLDVGKKMPLHIGAGPKVLLAYSEDAEIKRFLSEKPREKWTPRTIIKEEAIWEDIQKIRTNGYALSIDDVVVGTAAVGAPIRDATGKVIAAVSVAGLSVQYKGDKLDLYIRSTIKAASQISRKLGFIE